MARREQLPPGLRRVASIPTRTFPQGRPWAAALAAAAREPETMWELDPRRYGRSASAVRHALRGYALRHPEVLRNRRLHIRVQARADGLVVVFLRMTVIP